MALPKEFIIAWRACISSPQPIWNARHRKYSAPTYEIERGLDLLGDDAYYLGQKAIDGDLSMLYLERVSEGLEELRRLDQLLQQGTISASARAMIKEYWLIMETLFLELKKLLGHEYRPNTG